MPITSMQSFILIAWKLWKELITQTCYSILKPKIKIDKIENAIIMPVNCFKSIARKLSDKLITQTCYHKLKPNLKID